MILYPPWRLLQLKDENGLSHKTKYRIIGIGYLDPHSWTKHDWFAPILSQIELQLLRAISV